MFVTSPSLFHSRHFERALSRGFGLDYIALGVHFGTHLEKNSVRFEESVLDRTLAPFWNCFFWIFGAPGLPRRNPFWKPFRFMLPSRGALRLKIEDFGGVWLLSFFFCRDFAPFLEGSWTVKTLISHGSGSKNHNFTEVRILSLVVSILGVILEPKSL